MKVELTAFNTMSGPSFLTLENAVDQINSLELRNK